jgi:agmatine deiminase
MNRYILIIFCFTFSYLTVTAQVFDQQFLPKGFAPGEKEKMGEYLDLFRSRSSFSSEPPQASSLRSMAEWEETQAVFITWTSYLPVHTNIIKSVQQETPVVIICSDSNNVKSYLTTNNTSHHNLSFLQVPFNSVWIRDYFANSVYMNDVDSLILVDWIYNRPRPRDDSISRSVSRLMDIPLYETSSSPWDLVHTGGNYMSDGKGTGFSSKLVLDENPSKSNVQVDEVMNRFMGLNNYIKMTNLPYDGIHHIDMHMKLLDEETLLVGQYPEGIADGPQIEANIQYVLDNFQSMFGTPFKIIRIPMPPQINWGYPPNGYYLTYTNSVIVNKTVVVPQYYAQYDTLALRIYRENMPGYNVVGVNSNSTISAGGSIHCITHSVGASEPLLIVHQPLRVVHINVSNYYIEASIKHRSGIETATVFYRYDTLQEFQALPMVLVNGDQNVYGAEIPLSSLANEIHYYIHAKANSGKEQVRPMTAPEGYWKFSILDPFSNVALNTITTLKKPFPNPSNGITCIPVNNPTAEKGSIELRDITGKLVRIIFSGQFQEGDKNFFLDISGITPGAYLIVLQTEHGRKTEKLMVR